MCKYKRNYPNHSLITQLLLPFVRKHVCCCGDVRGGWWGSAPMQFAYPVEIPWCCQHHTNEKHTTLLCSFPCWKCFCDSQLLLVGLRLRSARRKGLFPAGTQGTEKAHHSAPLSLTCTIKQDLVLTHSYLSWSRVTGTQTQSKATLGLSQFVHSQERDPMYPKDLMTSRRHFGILF